MFFAGMTREDHYVSSTSSSTRPEAMVAATLAQFVANGREWLGLQSRMASWLTSPGFGEDTGFPTTQDYLGHDIVGERNVHQNHLKVFCMQAVTNSANPTASRPTPWGQVRVFAYDAEQAKWLR
jgi:hypothetical protein